jgi:hypothetical protein
MIDRSCKLNAFDDFYPDRECQADAVESPDMEIFIQVSSPHPDEYPPAPALPIANEVGFMSSEDGAFL